MELDRRVTKLEDALNGFRPSITNLSVSMAEIRSELKSLSRELSTVKDLAQQSVSTQLIHARCAAVQEERWRGHTDEHARLEDNIKAKDIRVDNLFSNQGELLDKVGSYVTTNRINIGKILAVGGGGGVIGGSLLTIIIELVKAFL